MKVKRCGSVDSKYFGNLNKFDEDIKKNQESYNRRTEEIKTKVESFLVQDPNYIEENYRILIDVVKEIKEKYEL